MQSNIPIDLITISREYGAGASMLAKALADRLEWRSVDQDLPAAIAKRLNLPADALVEADEHSASLLERVGQALVMGSPDMLVNSEIAKQPAPADVARITRQLLLEAVQRPPLIVVGHGSQALFQSRPGTLRLRLVAPLERRVELIRERRGVDHNEGVRLARRLDADRAHYIKEYFRCDVHDPLLYHLIINTALVDLAESVELVVGFVERRRG